MGFCDKRKKTEQKNRAAFKCVVGDCSRRCEARRAATKPRVALEARGLVAFMQRRIARKWYCNADCSKRPFGRFMRHAACGMQACTFDDAGWRMPPLGGVTYQQAKKRNAACGMRHVARGMHILRRMAHDAANWRCYMPRVHQMQHAKTGLLLCVIKVSSPISKRLISKL